MDITKEFSILRNAIKMGHTRGRQKSIEKAFKDLESAILNGQPKVPWWKFWDKGKVEI